MCQSLNFLYPALSEGSRTETFFFQRSYYMNTFANFKIILKTSIYSNLMSVFVSQEKKLFKQNSIQVQTNSPQTWTVALTHSARSQPERPRVPLSRSFSLPLSLCLKFDRFQIAAGQH